MTARRQVYALSMAVLLAIVAVVLVKGFSSSTFTLAQATPAPTKVCVPASVPVGGTTVCTITIKTTFMGGDTITDMTTGPGVTNILSCSGETGGLSCVPPAAPPKGKVTTTTKIVTCANYTCPSGSHFSLSITANAPGPLKETILEMIGGYAQGPFAHSGEAVFTNGTAPTKVCTNANPHTGTFTVCTLTLTSAVAAGGQVVDAIVSPSPAVISACVSGPIAGPPSAIVCGPTGFSSMTLTCPSGCARGTAVSLGIVGLRAGPLVEQVSFPAASGAAGPSFPVVPVPPVNFVGLGGGPTGP